MEVSIKLYGDLRKFGNTFKLKDVKNTAECLNALYCQINGFRMAIQRGYFNVKIGENDVSMETLKDDITKELQDKDEIHITPVIAGSGGVGKVITGAFLVIGGVLTGGLGFVLAGFGAALALGGISELLSKQPDNSNPKLDEVEKKQSTSFSNLQNLIAQGRPVPLAIGRIMTGSLVIGKGVETHVVNRIDDEGTGSDPIFGLSRGN